jgi:hypothetical protein
MGNLKTPTLALRMQFENNQSEIFDPYSI